MPNQDPHKIPDWKTKYRPTGYRENVGHIRDTNQRDNYECFREPLHLYFGVRDGPYYFSGVRLFCTAGAESRLWARDLPVSFIISFFCGNMVSLFFSQCRPHRYLSALSAEASFVRSKLLNTNGQSLFPLCSTCHLMCHFDWQRSGGANLQMLSCRASSEERHSSKASCPFLVSLSYYLHNTVRGAAKFITLDLKGLSGNILVTCQRANKAQFFPFNPWGGTVRWNATGKWWAQN